MCDKQATQRSPAGQKKGGMCFSGSTSWGDFDVLHYSRISLIKAKFFPLMCEIPIKYEYDSLKLCPYMELWNGFGARAVKAQGRV